MAVAETIGSLELVSFNPFKQGNLDNQSVAFWPGFLTAHAAICMENAVNREGF